MAFIRISLKVSLKRKGKKLNKLPDGVVLDVKANTIQDVILKKVFIVIRDTVEIVIFFIDLSF